MSKITIVEVGPRDGLQSEPEILPTDSKVVFIEKAIDAGIRRLEVASFVHPKLVPQMADAEALIEKLPQRDDVSYIGLIMNERTYNRKNQNVGTDDSVAAWKAIGARAKENGLRANVMISSAFGCPYEGVVEVERVVELAKQVTELEPAELGIADSIGVAVPAQVTDLLGRVKEVIGAIPLRCHFHNTRNTGLFAAVEAGVTYLDASIGGIGGCPFAPAATGNIPTDDLLYMLERSGIETGVSLEKIMDISRWLEEQLGRGVPALLPKAGGFPTGQAA
jgi:hydroxymethylglutaryl-CoA lyase